MARPSITQLPPTGLDRFRGLLTRADDLTGGLLAAVPGIGTLAALNRSGSAAQAGDYTKAVESLTDVIPVGRLASNAIRGITRGRSAGDIGGLLNIDSPQQSDDIRVRQQNNEKIYERDGVRVGVWENSPWSPRPMSITDFVVDENMRGKGVGKKMLDDVLAKYDLSQVSAAASSAPSAALFYKKGLRPASNPNATLEQTIAQMKEDSSVTMLLPKVEPAKIQFEYPQQAALDTAQRNAALPVEQGGLGLRPDNTPMERELAMGGKRGVHFSRTGADVTELDSGKYAVSPFDAIGTHIGSKDAANQRFENTARYSDVPKGVSYEVSMLGNNEFLNKNGKPMTELELIDDLVAKGAWQNKDYKAQNADLRQKYFSQYDRIPYVNDVEDAGNVSYIVPPWNIRSVNAAFDPMRRNEADLLAFRGNMGGTTLGNINPLLGLLDDENQ